MNIYSINYLMHNLSHKIIFFMHFWLALVTEAPKYSWNTIGYKTACYTELYISLRHGLSLRCKKQYFTEKEEIVMCNK